MCQAAHELWCPSQLTPAQEVMLRQYQSMSCAQDAFSAVISYLIWSHALCVVIVLVPLVNAMLVFAMAMFHMEASSIVLVGSGVAIHVWSKDCHKHQQPDDPKERRSQPPAGPSYWLLFVCAAGSSLG